ncbi:hypothetical protein CP980_00765 [Streptomyces vinaceus]|uniref:Uncharacterized protein n=1 Tax=Streptomyces vinaceus TaxID=1960 RepID=A0A5J6J125_STRVI|nr:hypothetical protein CP980_00765 [Streptomyces vinaceus]GHE57004.1 hypothetical protein GCM10017778_46630 [Streptomyces vinaceus]
MTSAKAPCRARQLHRADTWRDEGGRGAEGGASGGAVALPCTVAFNVGAIRRRKIAQRPADRWASDRAWPERVRRRPYVPVGAGRWCVLG